MLRPLAYGMKLLRKHFRHMAAIAFSFVMFGVFATFAATDLSMQLETARAGQTLKAHGATVFSTHYPYDVLSGISLGDVPTLIQAIQSKQAYATVLFNSSVSNPDQFDGRPTVIICGDVIQDIYPAFSAERTPAIFLGSSLAQPIVKEGSAWNRVLSNAPVYRLPSHTSWFDPNAGAINLDSTQIFLVDPSHLTLLDSYATEELVTRACFLEPDSQVIESFVSEAASKELMLVPQETGNGQAFRFNTLMERAALFLLAMGALAFVAMSAYARFATILAQAEVRSLMIRKMCGCPPSELYIALAVFVAALSIILPSAVSLMFCALFPYLMTGFMYTFLCLIVLGLVLYGTTLYSIRSERSFIL